jgi:hypothetical protein
MKDLAGALTLIRGVASLATNATGAPPLGRCLKNHIHHDPALLVTVITLCYCFRCTDFDPWRGSYGDQCRWGSPSWKVPWVFNPPESCPYLIHMHDVTICEVILLSFWSQVHRLRPVSRQSRRPVPLGFALLEGALGFTSARILPSLDTLCGSRCVESVTVTLLFHARGCSDFDPWRGSYGDQCSWGSPSRNVPWHPIPESCPYLIHMHDVTICEVIYRHFGRRCTDFDPWRGSYGDQCRWGSPSWKVPWEAWGVDDTKLFRWPGRGVWALTGRYGARCCS